MVELVNVLHLRSSVVVGGVETSLVGWMRHADSLGVHARLFCFEQGDGAEQPFLDYLKRRGLRAELVPWGRHRRFFAALKVLHSAIRHAWPCVVHTHDHRSDVIGWIAARRAGAPVVASNHAWHGLWRGIGWKEHVVEALRTPVLKRFDRVVDVSQATQRETLRRGIASERSCVIYTGHETRSVRRMDPAERACLRAAHGIGPDDLVVGNMARLYPEKGQHDLLEAAAQLLRLRPSLIFVVIGTGPLEQALRQRAQALGIAARVRWVPFQDDLSCAMALFDVFVLPSLMEGVPIVVYDAMAFGLPIVASDVGGVGEVIQDGVNGLLCPPGNASMLAKVLMQVVDDEPLRSRLSQGALDTAQRDPRFCAASSAAAYARLYRELLTLP